MALFSSPKEKTYADIVSPLKQIESDLSTYIGDKTNQISNLEQEKKQIDKDISAADLEVKKSEHTVVKISELLGTDFDLDEDSEVNEK
jgi:hypothetical protein